MNRCRRPFGGWNLVASSRGFTAATRLLFVAAVACLALTGVALSASPDLPRTGDDLVGTIRNAIEKKDYDRFEELVYWEGAGKIKRRIVAFQIRRGLGRKIDSIAIEDFPENGMAGIAKLKQLRVNMPVTHRVRVTYDEPPINDQGKLPTSVFLVGKHDGAYRIALVVRNFDDDGD